MEIYRCAIMEAPTSIYKDIFMFVHTNMLICDLYIYIYIVFVYVYIYIYIYI